MGVFISDKDTAIFYVQFFRSKNPNLDCEHSLIFLCKVTASETQGRERQSREPCETRA